MNEAQIERPILFSTSMVQAILDGKKTQTRRVIKPQLHAGTPDGKYRYDGIQEGIHAIELLDARGEPTEKYYSCCAPRCLPEDILWVRETWSNKCQRCFDTLDKVSYCASCEIYNKCNSTRRPSIHMPRAAARIFLRMTDVRVERLQDISLEDIEREGLYCDPPYTKDHFAYPGGMRLHWIKLWDSLNSKRGYGWDTNPWVWVYVFEVIKNDN